jgi:hypothetical protein
MTTSVAAPAAPTRQTRAARRALIGRRSKAVATFFVLLCLFLIAFPKGGIKIAGVPLTWGYILIGLVSPLALVTIAPPPKRCLLTLAMSIPFMLFVLPMGTLQAFGASGIGLGFIFSAMMSFGIFPAVFYGLFSSKLKKIPPEVFVKTIVWSVRFIALYGIFLFIYQVNVGTFFQIPYLTVNAADAGELSEKPIMRAGGIAKLISTYNNGNIYGPCLAMILPVYLLFERKPTMVVAVWSSMFLTISRTCWAGGGFLIILLYFIGNKPSAKRILGGFFALLVGVIIIGILLQLLGRDITWLVDPSLGGRASKYDDTLLELSLMPTGSVAAFGEIVYLGILRNYGLVAFLCFLPFFWGGMFLSYKGKYAHHPVRRAARQGLMSYYFMSMSDGAILFIPVMVFFYFVTLLALEGQEVLPLQDPETRQLLK